MGVPLNRGKELIGMAEIANRPGGYSEEVIEQIQPLIVTCATMTHAYRDTLAKDNIENSLLESEGT